MQEKNKKIRIITIQGYYKNLTKKEKSNLLIYISNKYGYMQNTIRAKLAGTVAIRDYEIISCEEAINNEDEWRI